MAFVYLAAVLLAEIKKNFTVRPSSKHIKIALVVAACIGVFGYFSYTKFFASFLQNVFDIDFITRNLTLAGGYSTVNPWLVMCGFVIVIWWATTKHIDRDFISSASLVIALVVPIVVLFTWSYFLNPFTPQYGAWKYLYIGAGIACPLAIIAIGEFVKTETPRLLLRSIPILILFGCAVFAPPFNKVQWASSKAVVSTSYAQVIVDELRRDPTRPVGCLTTAKNDSSNGYVGYLCSRMAFGLGGFDDVAHRVWTAANFCQISTEQAKADLPIEFQKNFTVVLFDGTRTSSFANCQAPAEGAPNGWLSSMNWNVIRKVDTSGKVVSIPATQFER
jgi:hypothetical protein